jgi:hypothetical protein
MLNEKFYGKYRGTVVGGDPKVLGRILVEVPAVLGLGISTWAMPSFPFTGLQMGMYVVPLPKTGVWVEFENGDLDYPIWTGCWWGDKLEVPLTAQTAPPALPIFILETALKSGFVLSDTPVPSIPPLPIGLPAGGIILKSGASYIRIDSTGISIFGPKVTINSSAGPVDVNAGALTVLPPGAPV